MSTLSERLELALGRAPGRKPAELARACGVRAPSVSDWLSGKTKKMEGANLLLAAEYLDVEPWWLATGEGPMERTSSAPVPHRETSLGAAAQALVDEISAADKRGLDTHAFNVLKETLRLFAATKSLPPGTMGVDESSR